MKEFPKGGLIGKVMDAAKTVKQMHIPLHAAYAAYFIILAFFPALVLILSVLRYTGMEVKGLVAPMKTFHNLLQFIRKKR